MSRLKPAIQEFIVRCLAVERMTPTQVVQAVKDEFEVEVTRQQVRHYNPEQSSECAKEWREKFEQLRADVADDEKTIPISLRAHRLRVYQRLLDAQLNRDNPNVVLILSILKQGAQDEGGCFASKADDGPPPPLPPAVERALLKVYGEAVEAASSPSDAPSSNDALATS